MNRDTIKSRLIKVLVIVMLALAVTGCASSANAPMPNNVTSGLAYASVSTSTATPTPSVNGSWLYADNFRVLFLTITQSGNTITGTYEEVERSGIGFTDNRYALQGTIEGNVIGLILNGQTMTGSFNNGLLTIGLWEYVPATSSDYVNSVKALCKTWNESC